MAGSGELDWSRTTGGGPIKLTYAEVMRDALALLRRQRLEIGRLLLAPLLIAFAVQTVNLFTAPSEGMGAVFGGLGPVAFLITVYLGVWLAVSVTRLVVWGRVESYLPLWRRADWRYFGYMLLFWFGFILVAFFVSAVLGVGAAGRASGEVTGMVAAALQALVVAGLACLYPFARFWLMLPAAALGPGFGPKRAWALSAAHGGTLVARVVARVGRVLA
ncbi:MAG: hypothetical protein WD100_06445, partial [Tistlia sp.]